MGKNKKTPAAKAGRLRNRKRRKIKAKLQRSLWILDHAPCNKCGSWDRLEIDHITPLNKPHDNIDIFMRSPEKQDAELSKCQVLCWSCHRIKSALERRKYEHGINLYDRHGCRCQICRAAHASKRREVRRKQHARGLPWSMIN